MEEESWRRILRRGIMEEESWKRSHGAPYGSTWEASGRHLETPGRLLEAPLGLLGSRGVLE